MINLILTSSTIDKKLEIYKYLENKLGIDKKLENELKINKKNRKFGVDFGVDCQFRVCFRVFCNFEFFLSMVDEVTIRI